MVENDKSYDLRNVNLLAPFYHEDDPLEAVKYKYIIHTNYLILQAKYATSLPCPSLIFSFPSRLIKLYDFAFPIPFRFLANCVVVYSSCKYRTLIT